MIKKYVFPIIIIYIMWWISSLVINHPILPLPHNAIIHFINIFPRQLWKHMLISFYRVVSAIGISILLALPLGLFIGRNKILDEIFSPIIYLLYPIPKIAFLPIIMLLFGLKDFAKIFTIALIVFFLILITVRDAAKNIDKEIFQSLISMGASKRQLYYHVVIPAVMPEVFTTLRVSIGTAIAVLFFTETFATSYGIGFFIIDSWTRMNYNEMFAGIICLSLIGIILYSIVDILEKNICRWKNY